MNSSNNNRRIIRLSIYLSVPSMKTVESMHMPHSLSDAAKTKIIRVLTPNLNFDYSGKNAFYSVLEFKGP
jgi:hypothetical protein